MKNPIVLTVDPIGGSVETETVLYPQKMQLNLRTDGQSACTMTLAPECEDVDIGKIVQLWAPNGDTCIMYVKSRNRDYATGIQTLTLEHVFGLLKDMIVFGEITPPDMTGTATDTTIAVEDALEYLLGQQTAEYFELYVCDFDDEEGWKFTNSDVYSALNSIADSIENCQWEFDFSTFPWSISLVEIPSSSEVDMEMRKDRNVSSVKVNIDRSQMYTRAYPTGKNDLHIDSVNSNVSYVDYNTGTYGVICKVITDSTIDNPTLLKKWAQKQVKRNSVPKITVTVDGYELSQMTGESLDHFRTGLRCRVTVPDLLDDPIVERMTELSWSDCVSAPNHVTCTLANDLKTITGIIFEQVAQSRGAGSRKANTEHDNELGKHSSAIIQDIKLEGPTNNIYYLYYQRYKSTAWTLIGDFSRAIDHWVLSWDNGTFTATAKPQDQSCWTEIGQEQISRSGTSLTIEMYARESNHPDWYYQTGYIIHYTIQHIITDWAVASPSGISGTSGGASYSNSTFVAGGYGYYCSDATAANPTVAIVVNGSWKDYTTPLTSPDSQHTGAVLKAVPTAIWQTAYQVGWSAGRNSLTQITMYRGEFDSASQTYTCTCYLSGAIATGATFYLYAK